jgi:hypothetical protein
MTEGGRAERRKERRLSVEDEDEGGNEITNVGL